MLIKDETVYFRKQSNLNVKLLSIIHNRATNEDKDNQKSPPENTDLHQVAQSLTLDSVILLTPKI